MESLRTSIVLVATFHLSNTWLDETSSYNRGLWRHTHLMPSIGQPRQLTIMHRCVTSKTTVMTADFVQYISRISFLFKPWKTKYRRFSNVHFQGLIFWRKKVSEYQYSSYQRWITTVVQFCCDYLMKHKNLAPEDARSEDNSFFRSRPNSKFYLLEVKCQWWQKKIINASFLTIWEKFPAWFSWSALKKNFIIGAQIRTRLEPVSTILLLCSRGFRVALNWKLMMPRDAILSDSCTPGRCRFFHSGG